MKKTLTVLAGFSVLTLTTISCQKEDLGKNITRIEAPQSITASVPAGQTYTLDLGTGSAATIAKQASHFQISEVSTETGGNAVYRYLAAKGFIGTDAVTLQQTMTSTSQASGGCGNHEGIQTTTTIKTVVLNFTVSN